MEGKNSLQCPEKIEKDQTFIDSICSRVQSNKLRIYNCCERVTQLTDKLVGQLPENAPQVDDAPKYHGLEKLDRTISDLENSTNFLNDVIKRLEEVNLV